MIFLRVHYAFAEFRGGGAGSAPSKYATGDTTVLRNTNVRIFLFLRCVFSLCFSAIKYRLFEKYCQL